MAAAIIAIKRKKEARAKRAGAPAGGGEEEDSQPPEWASKSCVGRAWIWFWSKTDMDEKFWSKQDVMSKFYHNGKCQAFVAFLIVGNFLCTIVQMTIDPRMDIIAGAGRYPNTFYKINTFFNVCFLVELIINLYAHWFWKFWWSPGCTWNWFDFFVVTLGMLSVAKTPMPGTLSLLRNMRAFRVFRLFKRIKALNQILQALGRAIAGVSSAFVVITIVMSIYAILGVAFFKDIGSTGVIVVEYGDYDGWYQVEMDGISSRGIPFGEEYFGNFGRALFTCFELLLGDSWCEVVGKTIVWGDHGPSSPVPRAAAPALGALYIVSFMIINAVVLTNVVVAVLLEKVIDDGGNDGDEAEKGDGEGAEKDKEDKESPKGKSRRRGRVAEEKGKDATSERRDLTRDEEDDEQPPIGANPYRVDCTDGMASLRKVGDPGKGGEASQMCDAWASLAGKVEALQHQQEAVVVPTLETLHSELAALRSEQRELVASLKYLMSAPPAPAPATSRPTIATVKASPATSLSAAPPTVKASPPPPLSAAGSPPTLHRC